MRRFYTNALNVLDLAKIPLRSEQRGHGRPLVIAGGHACFNPEPMHAFIDAFVVGEGEEVMMEIITAVESAKVHHEQRRMCCCGWPGFPGCMCHASTM